jgi:hypothetical protein
LVNTPGEACRGIPTQLGPLVPKRTDLSREIVTARDPLRRPAADRLASLEHDREIAERFGLEL